MWDLLTNIHAEQHELAPAITAVAKNKEAYIALLEGREREYAELMGYPPLQDTSIRVLQRMLDISMNVYLEGNNNYSEMLDKEDLLLNQARTFFDNYKHSRGFPVRELVTRKVQESELYPPSPTMRYSLQVIAYNEMPNSEGIVYTLPNLAVQLQSMVKAAKNYCMPSQGVPAGKADEIELLFNINNSPLQRTKGNERSLALLNSILSDTPIEEVMASFDWLPPEGKQHKKKTMAIRDFYYKLLSDARMLLQKGMHIIPIDCTDGSYIAGNPEISKDMSSCDTQGSRRRLLSDVALERASSVRANQAYMIALDADELILPHFFERCKEMLDQDGENPAIHRSVLRLRPVKGYYFADIYGQRDESVQTKEGERKPRVIGTFTDAQLTELKKITVEDTQPNEDFTEELTRRGFNPAQITLLQSFSPQVLEEILGSSKHDFHTPFFETADAILMIKNGANSDSLISFINNDIEHLKGQYREVFEKKAVSGEINPFRSLYLLPLSVYAKSERWAIGIDQGEDTQFIKMLGTSPGLQWKYHHTDTILIRDRIREESWFGRRTTRTGKPTEQSLRAIVSDVFLKEIGIHTEVDSERQPEILLNALSGELPQVTIGLSEKERALVKDIKQYDLWQVRAYGKAVQAASFFGLMRTVFDHKEEYPRLYTFFEKISGCKLDED